MAASISRQSKITQWTIFWLQSRLRRTKDREQGLCKNLMSPSPILAALNAATAPSAVPIPLLRHYLFHTITAGDQTACSRPNITHRIGTCTTKTLRAIVALPRKPPRAQQQKGFTAVAALIKAMKYGSRLSRACRSSRGYLSLIPGGWKASWDIILLLRYSYKMLCLSGRPVPTLYLGLSVLSTHRALILFSRICHFATLHFTPAQLNWMLNKQTLVSSLHQLLCLSWVAPSLVLGRSISSLWSIQFLISIFMHCLLVISQVL